MVLTFHGAEVLLSKKLIDKPTLNAVLRTQDLLANNVLSAEQAKDRECAQPRPLVDAAVL